MFKSDKTIFIEETEIKPNRYATIAMSFCVVGILFCWLLNEIGLFRVGTMEMRLGSISSFVLVSIPLAMILIKKDLAAHPAMKYVIMASTAVFTLTTTTLLTFHTTIMLIFPICLGMLYKSRKLGLIGLMCSVFCTVVSPVLGYILGTWDVPLFQELILIATNGNAVIEGASPGINTTGVLKILLYLVLPRLIVVGSVALLMFYVISLAMEHVNTQIAINNLSHRDSLTGLFNRNYLTDVLADKAYNGVCTIIFFDVNGLKEVNDRLGHEAGDLLLKTCAESIKVLCDEEKIAGFRLGGDEFILMAFDFAEADIIATLNKIQESLAISNQSPEFQRNSIVCSMATGYATGNFADSETLIRTADSNMYINKKAMKNSR